MRPTEIEILQSNYDKCQKALNEVLKGAVWKFMTVHTDQMGNTTTQGSIYTTINKEEFITEMQKENAILVESVRDLMFEIKKAHREIDTLITANRELRKKTKELPEKSIVLVSSYSDHSDRVTLHRIYFERDFDQAKNDLELLKTFASSDRDWSLWPCEIYNNKPIQTDEK